MQKSPQKVQYPYLWEEYDNIHWQGNYKEQLSQAVSFRQCCQFFHFDMYSWAWDARVRNSNVAGISRTLAMVVAIQKEEISIKKRWILKVFVIDMITDRSWLDLLSAGVPRRSISRYSFFVVLFGHPLKPESYTEHPCFLACVSVCLCIHVFKHTSHLEYSAKLGIIYPIPVFCKSKGISNIYCFGQRKSITPLVLLIFFSFIHSSLYFIEKVKLFFRFMR